MPVDVNALVLDLRSFDPPRREAAVTALAACGDEAVPALGPLLRDPASDVRRFALRALASAQPTPAILAPWVPDLVRSLAAADSSRERDDPGAEEARLAHDVLVGAGEVATESLAELALQGRGAVGPTYARQLLAGYGARALPVLTAGLRGHPHEAEEALRLLEQLGPVARPAAADVLALGRVAPFVGGQLLAVQALEACGAQEEAAGFLRELLRVHGLQRQAARRLLALHPGDAEAIATLVTLLRDSPPEHRLGHARDLAAAGPEAARQAAELLGGWDGTEPALLRLGPTGLEVLADRLDGGDDARLVATLRALAEAPAETRADPGCAALGSRLEPALTHADAAVRVAAARVLHGLGLLEDEPARARLEAELSGPAKVAARRALTETGLSTRSAADRVADALAHLDAVGWFDRLPPRARTQVQRQLKRAAKEGDTLAAGLPCACLDCEDPADEALRELARGSSGLFKPKRVRADPRGSDGERVAFELDGFPVAADLDQGDPDQLLTLANRALQAASREVRFFRLPGGAQESYAALTSPEAFAAAQAQGLFDALESL